MCLSILELTFSICRAVEPGKDLISGLDISDEHLSMLEQLTDFDNESVRVETKKVLEILYNY